MPYEISEYCYKSVLIPSGLLSGFAEDFLLVDFKTGFLDVSVGAHSHYLKRSRRTKKYISSDRTQRSTRNHHCIATVHRMAYGCGPCYIRFKVHAHANDV